MTAVFLENINLPKERVFCQLLGTVVTGAAWPDWSSGTEELRTAGSSDYTAGIL